MLCTCCKTESVRQQARPDVTHLATLLPDSPGLGFLTLAVAALCLVLCDEVNSLLLGILCRHHLVLTICSQLLVRWLRLMLCSKSGAPQDSCLLLLGQCKGWRHAIVLDGSSAPFSFSRSAGREH